MKVTYAVSHPMDLKLLSLQALRNDRVAMGQLALVPGLRRFISSTWWIPSGRRSDDYEDEVKVSRSVSRKDTGSCSHQDSTLRVRRLCLMCDILLWPSRNHRLRQQYLDFLTTVIDLISDVQDMLEFLGPPSSWMELLLKFYFKFSFIYKIAFYIFYLRMWCQTLLFICNYKLRFVLYPFYEYEFFM